MMNQFSKRGFLPNIKRYLLVLIWGFGYFFGYSIIAFATIWMVQAEEFSVLVRGRKTPKRSVFKRFGNIYLAAEWVALVGWIFVSCAVFLATQ